MKRRHTLTLLTAGLFSTSLGLSPCVWADHHQVAEKVQEGMQEVEQGSQEVEHSQEVMEMDMRRKEKEGSAEIRNQQLQAEKAAQKGLQKMEQGTLEAVEGAVE